MAHIQQHIQMIMLVPSRHNINLWTVLISPMTATAPFRILNEVCHGFKCAGDGVDNNLIEMSTTKMKRQEKILSLFNQTLRTVAASIADYSIWRLQSGRDFSSCNWGNALIATRVKKKKQRHENCTPTRQPPINNTERRVCIDTSSIYTSVKMGDTSSCIPHRLNNSSWSTSFLPIKKQCTARGFEWAVERKQLVSCQGEHPEIISIIYHTDTLQRKMRQGVRHTQWLAKRWNAFLDSWIFFFSFKLVLNRAVPHMAS